MKFFDFFWTNLIFDLLWQDRHREDRPDGVRRLRVRQPATHVRRRGRLGRRKKTETESQKSSKIIRRLFTFYFLNLLFYNY